MRFHRPLTRFRREGERRKGREKEGGRAGIGWEAMEHLLLQTDRAVVGVLLP